MTKIDYRKQTTIVTGASSGLGAEFARQLAARGRSACRRDAEHDGRCEGVRTTGGLVWPVSDLDDPCPVGTSVVDQLGADRVLRVVDDRGVVLARRAVGIGGLHQPVIALDEGVDL